MNKIEIIALLTLNVFSFVLMGIDKYKALHKLWRISEKTFFFLALFGGSIGVWLGMYFFRHKTRHKLFTIGIPLIIFCQILLFFYIKVW
ncbi:protein of unknown function DUF1294 [Thermoanaerobacter italicus Ab9]|uniref:DUF1294 domain-containing protein n=1 Tax=Thermoanaerobacter italicus (strain DSM 9252 / Ab9) TaxID=580331 RepID=D3T8E9_THEIA|nr:DUF1294 domain-containing protein [Thermoanaerobacter italicus]ADD02231.1 protein of unknown function DUF1294 [Thermoanaerobacter italicus Ab9]